MEKKSKQILLCKWLKYIYYSAIGFILIILITSIIASVINWLILRPRLFDIVGEGKDWLLFWSSFLSAIASFAMVFITWKTLRQNKEQVDVLKYQWREEHTPRVSASLITCDRKCYIRIKNISNVLISNLMIKITHDPEPEVQKSILNYNQFKKKLEEVQLSIEPNGEKDFILIYSLYPDANYPGFIGLTLYYNNDHKDEFKLYINEMTLISEKIERSEFFAKLDKISEEIRNKKL